MAHVGNSTDEDSLDRVWQNTSETFEIGLWRILPKVLD